MNERPPWLLCVAILLGAGCRPQTVSGPRTAGSDWPTPGRAVEVNPAASRETRPREALDAPPLALGRGGRAPRRMDVDQLRKALLAATGFTWVAARRVSDPDSKTGTTLLPDADMLEALAETLGRPDYVTSTSESIDPAVTFSKLASDAARSACRAAIKADVTNTTNDPPRHIMRETDVRKNLAYLALRFWGRTVTPADPQLEPLAHLYERASAAPAGIDANATKRSAGTYADGWRAACIAMVTDPQFLTY